MSSNCVAKEIKKTSRTECCGGKAPSDNLSQSIKVKYLYTCKGLNSLKQRINSHTYNVGTLTD